MKDTPTYGVWNPEVENNKMANSKIMIVDECPDLRQALRLRLRANDYDTVNAGDGYSRHRAGLQRTSRHDHS